MLDDGQPQAGAAGGFAPALIHPVKALKHTGLRFFRDADAVVFHGEGAVAVPGAGGNDLDFAAGAVVADGVVAQVLAQLVQQAAAAQHGSALAQIGEGDKGTLGVDFLPLHALSGDLQQINRLHREGRTGLTDIVQIGQLQDIVDQLDHPGCFHMDLPGKIRDVLGLCNACFNELCIAGDAGKRRFELMTDIGRKLLPHFFIVLPQQAVRMDALCKRNELFVGHIVLDAVKIIRHLQHRLHKAFGQQPGHECSRGHHQHTAQDDGGDGIIVDRPGRLRILSYAQDLAAGEQESVVIGFISGGLGIAAVAPDPALHGLLDLRAGEMIFQRLCRGGFKQNIAVRVNERDAQAAGAVCTELPRVTGKTIPGGYQIRFVLHCRPDLCAERLMEYKNTECCRA